MKKTVKILTTIVCILVIAPVVVYLIHFRSATLSDDTEIWSHFGNYLNGSLTPIVAITGIIVSFAIILYSQRNIEKQEMLQRPLAFIRPIDLENNLEIVLQNKGIGPLIVVNYRIINTNTGDESKSIYDCLVGLSGTFDFYTGNMDGLVITANDEKQLFQLTDKQDDFLERRTKVRELFKDLSIRIEYTDIYNKPMPTYIRNLEWYGRLLT